MRSLIYRLFVLGSLFLLFFIPVQLFAEQISFEYSIEFTTPDGDPVEAVAVHGTDGIEELNGRISGTDGVWSFDVRDLESSSPHLYYYKSGYKMSPESLVVNRENCPDNICEVVATSSTNETVIYKIEVLDPENAGLPGVSGIMTSLEDECPKVTDSQGLMFFSTSRRSGTCNDIDYVRSNDFVNVVLSAPYGKSCTFTALQSNSICPRSSQTLQFLSQCADDAAFQPKVEGIYHFEIKDDENNPIITEIYIYPNETSIQTDGAGRATISAAALGISAESTFRAIPVGMYNFYPPEVVVGPDTCPGNVCKIFAKSTFKNQLVGTAVFTDSSGAPLSGAQVDIPRGFSSCQENFKRTTTKEGKVFFPAKLQPGCDDSDASPLNDKIHITPSLRGCAFTDPSEQSFSFCATGNGYPVKNYSATCSTPDSGQHLLSGEVRGPNGAPFPGVKILANGVQSAISREDGTYSFLVPHGETAVLEAVSDDFVFDPKQVELKSVQEGQKRLNFFTFASATGLENGYIPEWCEAKSEYEIKGTVYNGIGERLPGATILNNHQNIAISDANGEFRFSVDAQSDNWVTAEYNDEYFDPAGISYPYISCDKPQTNFQVTQVGTFIYSGQILDLDGNPIPEVQLTFYENGTEYSAITDSSGYYFISASDGANCLIRVTDPNFACAPQEYSSVANSNLLNLHFECQRDLCPLDGSKMEAGQCGCGVPDTDSDGDGVADCNDACSNDAAKVEAGQCGCGVADTDTDEDGTANCNDTCFFDPLKTDAGLCGCGVEDDTRDSDADGTLDCNDACVEDPLKFEPGLCGCGVSDLDSDSDGTPNCQDLCIQDPGKVEPGVCGCGIPDTDSDGDGTFDCEDQCPFDRYKIEPGECGCGELDSDLDHDGVLQCLDLCDTDPNKTEPGICGCGRADRDSDSDGALDCNDECPFDENKNTEGVCGCGIAETDSDEDGVPDCKDECALDPLKTKFGQCGCGNPDTDTDGDSQCDCIDLCPNDPNKIEEGVCGCGILDKDTDNDGIFDCNDECIADPNKAEPGECGCGIDDIDFDGDGVLQCDDSCDEDPDKLTPGECGCGVPDIDNDSDTVLDCNDECPFDANKIFEGACGCGIPDTDSDGDGVSDCNDLCVNDPQKSAPGHCGCGNIDTDTDGDSIADCLDLCDEDPTKAEPGVCGCGVSDRDSDKDGIADCEDLCPLDRNKVIPGECGCGTPDVDSDGDGVLLCNDQCDQDITKVAPGICGCGVADIDSDGDGTVNCQESCEFDPLKTEPGICGCGVEDRDSDNDGTFDCYDGCITDAKKTRPGQCGCGVSDVDIDGDGTSDCNDLCITDSRKILPGVCGCGSPEIDADEDGYFQCEDSCDSDPDKVSPGICGCGVADTDSDGDGTADCQDVCPLDPLKVYPGLCDCGVADDDLNNNGIVDCEEMPLTLEALCIEPPSSFINRKRSLPTVSARSNRKNQKITICHIPPGNPDNAHSIEISESALPAHLAHGDTEGECAGDDSEQSPKEVTLCHTPPGDPDNHYTITVSETLAADHLAHGDTEGSCSNSGGGGSEEELETIKWKITNPNTKRVMTEVEVEEPKSTEREVYEVGAASEYIFTTTRLSGRNTVALYHFNGELVDRVTHPLELCPGKEITLSGALKGKNGRPIADGDRMHKILSSFRPGDIEIVAKNNKTRKAYNVNVTDPFSWEIKVPGGDYRVFLRSKRVRISSRPKNYRGSYYWDQGGFHHALRRSDLRIIQRNRKK